MEWRSRSPDKFTGDLMSHMQKVRQIEDMDEFLNPPPSVVNSPLLLKNIRQAMERVIQGVNSGEKIVIVADPDPDGIISTVLMTDYLSKHTKSVQYVFHERREGHGVQYSDVPGDTDLLIILDSSSSEVEECKRLSETMDIVIVDHHVLEVDENPYVILVNPQQKGCEYPNKGLSASAVVFKFIELLDYKYKKVDVRNYLDLVAISILSDQMNMRNLENRYFVKYGMENINNVGLLALLHSTRNNNKKITSQILNFEVIPILNTTTRNNEMRKAFSLLFEKDFFKAKAKADYLVKDNKKRKVKVRELAKEYKSIMKDEKFIFVTTKHATKNYNGLVSQQLASEYRKPAMVLKELENSYAGSYRSYNGFPLQDFLKTCPYVEYAAGHKEAGGIEVKKSNWDEFKQFVNENIDESQFEPIIEYDIELEEEELDWDLVNKIEEFNLLWGQNNDPITVRLNNVFVEDREMFPPKDPAHVKIKADNIDLMKFYDEDYADEVEAWNSISSVGQISVNNFRGKRMQMFMEDYVKG